MFLLTLAHIKALSQITAEVICKQLKDKTRFHKKPNQKMFYNTIVQKSAWMPFLYEREKVLYSSKYAEYKVIVLSQFKSSCEEAENYMLNCNLCFSYD